MSQEACVSDSNRGFESEGGEAGQQVPDSATETALSVTWLRITNRLRPGAGCVLGGTWQTRFCICHLSGWPPGSVHLLHVVGVKS